MKISNMQLTFSTDNERQYRLHGPGLERFEVLRHGFTEGQSLEDWEAFVPALREARDELIQVLSPWIAEEEEEKEGKTIQ